MTDEIQALARALNSGEAELNGVKYVVIDEDTVYRFQNNRMRKVSKTLINKAKKFVNQEVAPHPGNEFDEEGNVIEEKPKRQTRRKAQKVVPQEEPDEQEEPDDLDEVEPPPKPKRQARKKAQPVSPEFDINDYYQTKNKLEFVQLENDRLNQKVKKLKNYKQILNRLTGAEFDTDVPPQPYQQLPQQQHFEREESNVPRQGSNRNDSLFLF